MFPETRRKKKEYVGDIHFALQNEYPLSNKRDAGTQ